MGKLVVGAQGVFSSQEAKQHPGWILEPDASLPNPALLPTS